MRGNLNLTASLVVICSGARFMFPNVSVSDVDTAEKHHCRQVRDASQVQVHQPGSSSNAASGEPSEVDLLPSHSLSLS